MRLTTEQLYALLPAIYRIRDTEQGEPLKALVSIIAEQAGVVEADIIRLYENWFIETCSEWVVPYIGDLLGVRGLHSLGPDAPFSQRARVANTLSYRRRKGTATMLEQLARDTTGWNARAVEFFELLETTQHYNHIRLHNVRTPDLRLTNQLELVDTAFDTAAHTGDVRRIAIGRGRHNIPNIGLFIWRLQSYYVTRASAREVAPTGGPAAGRYTFSPLSQSAPLFNRAQAETEIAHLAEEINVPGILRRRPPYDELEARRQALIDGLEPDPAYFGSQPVFQVFVKSTPGDQFVEAPPEEILICNLSEPPVAVPEVWLRPPTSKDYQPAAGGPKKSHTITVAVDPVLGRLAFPKGVKPNRVNVSYAYGFSGDVGGGPYNRRESVEAALTRKVTWQAGVGKEATPVAGQIFATLAEAVKKWNLQPAGSVGVIAVLDSETYKENLTAANRLKIPEGSLLMIVAADWPEVQVKGGAPGQKQRVTGQLDADERRPHVLGDIAVTGTAPTNSLAPGELVLNGLLVEGELTVEGTLNGNLGALGVTHCTLVPEKGGLSVASKNSRLKIRLTRSICGPLNLPKTVPLVRIEESIVDSKIVDGTSDAIAGSGTAVEVEKSTVFGVTNALRLEAGNSIFTDAVKVTRRQVGCVRFSYVPEGSKTPRRFRCQPDLALENVKPADQAPIIARLVPSFTSEHYGHYGYGQLSLACAIELRTGAEDGSEMGVFSFLKQPQRATNLQTGLDEYLRFGLEAGIIYVT
ncbi:MAG TPA: hypothetical protein VJH03_06895 [Blastocatellia bacterium]|nr:hypothetical protein [Blastocatellia bacterium]